MKFETLKSFDKKKLIIPTIVICSIIIVIIIFISQPKYIYKDSITIMEGTKIDSNIIGIYQQKDGCEGDNCYQEVDIMPSAGYEINTDKTYCYIDDETKPIKNKIYTNNKGETVISGLSQKSKCFLYYDVEKKPSKATFDTLAKLGKLTSNGETAHFTDVSCNVERSCTETEAEGVIVPKCEGCGLQENGIYEAEDDDGTSYYFRGTVENNYVKFGKINIDAWARYYEYSGEEYSYSYYNGFYDNSDECQNDLGYDEICKKIQNVGDDIWWRIIRINGDGSIRMIFAGIGEKPSSGEDQGISINNGESYPFNTLSNSAEYVGYQYTIGKRKGHDKDSTAKIEIEKWFENNLLDEFNDPNSKIDTNAGFCADRTTYRSEYHESVDEYGEYMSYYTYHKDDILGTGQQSTTYGINLRIYPDSKDETVPAVPSLKCPDIENDLFTYKDAQNGTKSLKYPIGLITTDEVFFAGGGRPVNNINPYWNNKYYYWFLNIKE